MHEHPKQSFDIKTFIEIRVSLIQWLLFDIAFLAKQYDRYGFVTDSMVLVVAFQTWYIIDSVWFEEAFLTTMDVAYDPFPLGSCMRLKLMHCAGQMEVDSCWIWARYCGFLWFSHYKRAFWHHILWFLDH